MPFDLSPPTTSYDDMIRARRERAADIWRNVPQDQFDLSSWKDDAPCGTTACAIGWLCEVEFDGWKWCHDFDDPYPERDGHYGEVAAAHYFGLADFHSVMLFVSGSAYPEQRRFVTAKQVAETLLAYPIHLYADEEFTNAV